MTVDTDKSKIERLDNGNIKYRGQEFPGFNKPIKDSGEKQGKVLAKKGEEIKIVRFGDPSMPDNQSVEQNDRFYARFGKQPGIDDKFSALYWSARWLWPKGKMKGKGAKDFYTLRKNMSKDQVEDEFANIEKELESESNLDNGIEKSTYQDKVYNLQLALNDHGHSDAYYYFHDFDDDYVYMKDHKCCYRVKYSMSETGEVVLSDVKQKVVAETVFNVVEDYNEDIESSITKNIISWFEKSFGSSGLNLNGNTNLPVIKQFEEEQMIAVEPLYIAPFETTGDIDGHDDIMYEPEIRKMVDSFNSNLEKGNLGTKESHKQDVDYFTIEKAWVNECDCYIGEHFVPEGQPLVKTKFHDKDKWEERKSGELTGVSIGASAKSVEYIEIEIEEDE